MDGQLGMDGENAVVPHLMEQFLGLSTSDSVTDDSETKNTVPLKVWRDLYH